MMRIKTATGKEFPILWCGQSTIDSALRFAVKETEMADIINTFINPNETRTVVQEMDDMGNRKEYNGFTTFKGVDLNPDGSVVVSLMKN